MPGNDDIILRLIIKGQDPSEIIRLANETSGRLAQESAKHIDRLTELHKAAAEDQSAAMKKAIDSEIKESQKLLSAIQQIERQREIVANKATASYDQMLNRLKNVTIVAQALGSAFKSQAESFISLGNEIDRVVNVYGSLKGGIDEIREASKGEISDIDIISAKNRAFALDLHLTDTQFGIVAAAADRFADSIGGESTKEKFDTLIQGLTTGRAKTLLAGGVMEDTTKVVEEYAKAHHTVAEALTDEAKKIAVAEDALRSMDKKLIESGTEADNFAHEWEKTTATLTNTWDHMLLALGKFLVGVEQGLTIAVPGYIKIGIAKLKDLLPGLDEHFEDQARAEVGRKYEEYERQQDALVQKARARQGSSDAYKIPMSGPIIDRKKAGAYAAKQMSEEYFPDYNRPLDDQGNEIFGGRAGQYEKDQELLNIIGATAQGRLGINSGDYSAELERAANRTGHGPFDQTMGFDSDALEKQMAKVQPRVDQLKKEAGERGLLGMALFGPHGPDKLYTEMDTFQQATSDMAVAVTEAMHQMAEAVAAGLASWIANAQGAKKSFQDVTNELLIALSTKAFVKGLEAVAEAAGHVADYDYPAAAASLEEAAAWGALGVATGLAARAVGHSSSSTSTPSTRTSSSYGSASSGGGNSDKPSITINVQGGLGSEAEVGRAVYKALRQYQAETGDLHGMAA